MFFPQYLKQLIEKVESGAITIDTAELEIIAKASAYVRPPLESNVGVLLAWEDRVRELATTVSEFNRALDCEENPTRVLGLGRVAMAVARLLNANAEGKVAFKMGLRLLDLHWVSSAVDSFRKAGQLLASSEPDLAAQAMNCQLECLFLLKRFDEILETAPEVLRFVRQHGFKGIEVSILRYVGTASIDEDSEQAFLTLTEALALRLTLSPEVCKEQRAPSIASLHLGLAGAAAQKGDFQTALSESEKARRIYQNQGNAKNLAYVEALIGVTWVRIGEPERAIAYSAEAARIAEELGMSEEAMRWRGRATALPAEYTGQDFLVQAQHLLEADPSQPDKARERALRTIEEARRTGNDRLESEARNVLAITYLREDKTIQAFFAEKAAVQVAERLNDPLWEAQLRTSLGNILLTLGRSEEAEAEYQRALAEAREVHRYALNGEMRQATTAGIIRIYEGLVHLLAHKWERTAGSLSEERFGELFTLVQEIRAFNLVNWLALEQQIESRESPQLTQKLLGLRSAEVHLEMAALAGGIELSPLFEAQEEARAALQDSITPNAGTILTGVPVLSVKEISRFLEADECLVDFFATAEGIVIIMLGSDGRPRGNFCRWKRQKRIELVKRWQSAVVEPLGITQENTHSFQLRESICAALLEEMDKDFVNEIVAFFDKDHLPRKIYLAPHRELFQLPFWQLAVHVPGASISILPAPNALGLLHQRHRSALQNRLVLGDVTGTLNYVPLEVRSLPNFNNLSCPFDQMIRAVGDANLFHFSGHGQFNASQPYLSGIVAEQKSTGKLGPFDARTRFGESLLTVAHVLAQLHLPDCFLTILSGCSTGIPRIHPASESISLPMAFLIAGARNVIASLWPIHDAAACLLMKAFYDFFLCNDKMLNSPSVALAMARKKLSLMTRKEAIAQLGSDQWVPEADPPFASAVYTMAFEHFGVD